jgi:hypothetical protein
MSAVEGQQVELLEEKQASGLWEVPTRSDFLLDAEIRLFETFDWPDHLNNFFWLLRGKKQVWFDYLALLEYGLSGAQLEEMLNRHGIRVYGKIVCTEGDTYPAFVLVDKSRERQVRHFFAKLGILS